MRSLIHLIYASSATSRLTVDELPQLLHRSRNNNERLGLTGMLLYADGSFFQVLEGPADAVQGLYRRIEDDARHAHVTRIISEPIARRYFSDWSMGFKDVSDAAMTHAPDTNDFFGKAQSFNDVSYGRAKKLLAAFAGGRWRSGLRGVDLSGAR